MVNPLRLLLASFLRERGWRETFRLQLSAMLIGMLVSIPVVVAGFWLHWIDPDDFLILVIVVSALGAFWITRKPARPTAQEWKEK